MGGCSHEHPHFSADSGTLAPLQVSDLVLHADVNKVSVRVRGASDAGPTSLNLRKLINLIQYPISKTLKRDGHCRYYITPCKHRNHALYGRGF